MKKLKVTTCLVLGLIFYGNALAVEGRGEDLGI
jgi:hypothetical protein